APPLGRGAPGRQGRLRRRRRGLRRPLRPPARLYDGGCPPRHRLLPLEDHGALRSPRRARRRAERHAARRLARDPVLVPCDDESIAVHERTEGAEARPARPPLPRRLPFVKVRPWYALSEAERQ